MKVTKKLMIPAAAMVLALSLTLYSCQKDLSGNGGSSQFVSVYLTDAPVNFSAVNIDIKYVEVKVDTLKDRRKDDHACDGDQDRNNDRKHHDEFGVWDTLSYNAGVYDMLSLRNGVEAALGTLEVNGVVRKIRFTLGANSTVVKDGVTYPLNLAPGTSNYLYVSLHNEHRQDSLGTTKVWVDFDLARSIVEMNGAFYLRPVLKPFCNQNFAEVAGVVLPADAKAIVMVYNSSDTATAIPHPDGRFMVRGLKPGVYDVVYKASNGYKDVTVSKIDLKAGKNAPLQTVTLVK